MPLSDEQSAEIDRRLRGAEAIQNEMKRMAEEEVHSIRDEDDLVMMERFTVDYVERWNALAAQWLAAQEAIVEYYKSV